MSTPISSAKATRKDLRRAICRMAGMRFFRHYPNQYVTVSNATTPKKGSFSLSGLTQSSGEWVNGYVLFVSGALKGEFRRIISFQNTNNKVSVEFPFSSAPSVGDQVEILDWPPSLIHDAINRAIFDGFRSFPTVAEYSSIILEENRLEYSLTGVTPTIWMPLQVWLERTNSTLTGVVDNATGTTITDNEANFTVNEHVGKKISIYSGVGAGQLRTVSANTATVITVDSSWLEVPDSGSKYRIWDDRSQVISWYRLPAGRFVPEEFPTKLYLSRLYPELYGLRLQVIYVRGPEELTDDAHSTDVEREFIYYRSLSILHDMLVGDSSVNRSAHASLAEYYDKVARQIKADRGRSIPSRSMWIEEDEAHFSPLDDILWSG